MAQEKKQKKAKEEKIIDFSKMPDHIWEKTLSEFCSTMNELDMKISVMDRQIDRMVAFYCKE